MDSTTPHLFPFSEAGLLWKTTMAQSQVLRKFRCSNDASFVRYRGVTFDKRRCEGYGDCMGRWIEPSDYNKGNLQQKETLMIYDSNW